MKTNILTKCSLILGSLILTVLLSSCCNSNEGQCDKDTETPTNAKVVNEITLTPMTEESQFPDAKLMVTAINTLSQEANTANLQVEYALENFSLTEHTQDTKSHTMANSHQGQHIHFILDNEPYIPLYEPEHKFNIEKGSEHYLLSFLSRSYHESIKNPEAAVLNRFEITKDGEYKELPIEDMPMLFYSRPKGKYEGEEAKSILLDFYLLNVNLDEDSYKVKAKINDKEFIIDNWQTYKIEGLPMGESSVTLTLIDNNGNAISGNMGSITRNITLSE